MKLLVVILLLCTDEAMATLFNWVHGVLGSNCDTTCVGYGGCTGIAFASSPALTWLQSDPQTRFQLALGITCTTYAAYSNTKAPYTSNNQYSCAKNLQQNWNCDESRSDLRRICACGNHSEFVETSAVSPPSPTSSPSSPPFLPPSSSPSSSPGHTPHPPSQPPPSLPMPRSPPSPPSHPPPPLTATPTTAVFVALVVSVVLVLLSIALCFTRPASTQVTVDSLLGGKAPLARREKPSPVKVDGQEK